MLDPKKASTDASFQEVSKKDTILFLKFTGINGKLSPEKGIEGPLDNNAYTGPVFMDLPLSSSEKFVSLSENVSCTLLPLLLFWLLLFYFY